jgi:RecA/RadA recombinase
MKFSLTNLALNSLISSKDELASIIHIWGESGAGKTTLCFSASLSKLAQNKKVIYISTKSVFKSTRFSQLVSYYSPFDEYNFLLYHPSTFFQQMDIIMNLEFLILEEIHQLDKSSIGLIVVDGISILWHLEMKSDPSNQNTLRSLNTVLATLDYIRRTYKIPILIANRSVIRMNDDKNYTQPASNAVMEYWGKIKIKIDRTNDPSKRSIILENHPNETSLPKIISVDLTESGFT